MSTYAKIEHGMYEHPKIVGLSDTAFRAYVESILYSGKHLTDGFLDERIVRRMWGENVAEELCGNDPVNPSWVRVEGGWQIYGYCERQTSKAEIDALREQKRSAANARWDAKRNAEAMHGAYGVHSTSDAQAMPEIEVDINTLTSETKVSTSDDFSDDVKELTDYLAERIRANGNKVGAVGVRWWQACDRLLRVDERDPDEVRQVIDWCQKNEFWQGNILSMPKLREKYDTLRNQMNRDGVMKTKPKDYNPADYSRIKGWGFRYEDQQ